MTILVIGAGPVGLMAALALANQNIPCRIVERRTTPSELSRAVGIIPETIEALLRLGAGEAILAEAMPLRKIEVSRAGKILMQLDNTGPVFRDRVIMGLPQNRTEEIMRDILAAKGVQVAYGVSVETLTTDDGRATVTFCDGSTEQYDWVIAADGVHSTARTQLGIAYPGIDLPGDWSIADVDVARDFDPEFVQIEAQGRGGNFLIVLPIEARRVRIVSSTPDALAALDRPIKIARVRRTGTFGISIRQAQTYRKGRVLLAGDAAHCHSPLGGKGMNLGMADAVAAVQAIVNGQVDSYSDQRHAAGRDVIMMTERARKVVASDALWARLLFSFVTGAISTLPLAHRQFMRALTSL